MVESYKTLYKQAIDTSYSDFKAPINQIDRATKVVTPDDTQLITPQHRHAFAISGLICRSKACFHRAFLLSIHNL